MAITTRRYHARQLERRTRIRALEGQAQLLLNDLAEYGAWLEWNEGRRLSEDDVAERWLRDVYRPTLARISATVAPDRDLVQAYCDVLEEKWFLSERAGRDIGLSDAIDAYVALGAPAPETAFRPGDPTAVGDGLDVDPLELVPAEEEAAAGATAGRSSPARTRSPARRADVSRPERPDVSPSPE